MNEDNQIEEYAPWLALGITLAGFALRVLFLAKQGLWLDETFSVWLARHSLGEMLYWVTQVDEHPPLYYALLHFWIARFGDSAYYVRLLSAVIGAGTIPIIYLIGRRLSGAMVGLAAALLLALSPFSIRFGQETRMYTLLAFNVGIAIYAFVILLTSSSSKVPIGRQFRETLRDWRAQRPNEVEAEKPFSYRDESRIRTGWRAWLSRNRWPPIRAIENDLAWVTFIVFSVAALYTHNTAILFLVAANIFVIGLMLNQRAIRPGTTYSLHPPSLANWLIAQIGILVLWSPWLPALTRQASKIYHRFWIPYPGVDTILQALRSFLNENILQQADQAYILWIAYAVVLALGLVHFRKRMAQFILLLTLFAVPILAELVASIIRPIFSAQTLIWITLPLFLVLAAGISQLKYRVLIIAGLGVLAANNLFSTGDYYRYAQKEEWGNVAGFVANFAQKDDLVLFNASWVQIAFDYYFDFYKTKYLIQVEEHGVPVDLFDRGVLEPPMMQEEVPRLISLLSGHHTVWLVYSHTFYTDPDGIIPQTLASHLQFLGQRDFYGAQVQIYAAP